MIYKLYIYLQNFLQIIISAKFIVFHLSLKNTFVVTCDKIERINNISTNLLIYSLFHIKFPPKHIYNKENI